MKKKWFYIWNLNKNFNYSITQRFISAWNIQLIHRFNYRTQHTINQINKVYNHDLSQT